MKREIYEIFENMITLIAGKGFYFKNTSQFRTTESGVLSNPLGLYLTGIFYLPQQEGTAL